MPGRRLSTKLTRARESLGWSISEAVEQMPNTTYGTLHHLEGRAKRDGKPRREAKGDEIQLRTVVDLVTVYWPQLNLGDFMENAALGFDWNEQ